MYYGGSSPYGFQPNYGYCQQPSYYQQGNNKGYGYALILVLFILLVIIGASRF